MKRGQEGFTVVEMLLFLILLAIIGFTGYYVWHSQKQTDKTLSDASNEKILAPAKKSSSASANNQAPAPAAASKLVSDFYSQVYQALGGSTSSATPDRNQEKSLVQKYGTANLISEYNNIKGYDLITCSQNYAPFSVTSSAVSRDSADNTLGNDVVVQVHEAFEQTPIDFAVDVVNSGGLKIDSVFCQVRD